MKLTDVCFSYGDKLILDGFSIALPDGGVTALSGPSGCGKTTLLRLLGGLERPQSGSIDVPAPEEISFLFQENRLLPGLNAADQLRVVLPKGAEVQPWLDAVGLGAEANRLPASLSGGMQRRLALARCMAYGEGKKLLLLDEPFTGVDPQRTAALMKSLRRLGCGILYSAHDAESLALADQVIQLDGPPLHRHLL